MNPSDNEHGTQSLPQSLGPAAKDQQPPTYVDAISEVEPEPAPKVGGSCPRELDANKRYLLALLRDAREEAIAAMKMDVQRSLEPVEAERSRIQKEKAELEAERKKRVRESRFPWLRRFGQMFRSDPHSKDSEDNRATRYHHLGRLREWWQKKVAEINVDYIGAQRLIIRGTETDAQKIRDWWLGYTNVDVPKVIWLEAAPGFKIR